MAKAKPYAISRREVWVAYEQVKANRGAAGVDGQTLQQFEADLADNLYVVWNRLASGSYLPPPVRRVEIPKASGTGVRTLGIPTVQDRIAQTVVKNRLEPVVDPRFHPNSYGYRPRKSAREAVGVARRRCWQYAWVVDLDLQHFFDTIPHEQLLAVVRPHVSEAWMMLYLTRWLTVPSRDATGHETARSCGTPQGGVVSPVLANCYLHAVFDTWMAQHYPHCPFERYADDIIVHCRTEAEARALWQAIAARVAAWGLTLHPTKTQVVYCRDSNRRGPYRPAQFDFLGYTVQPRRVKRRDQAVLFTSFSPAISRRAQRKLRTVIRGWRVGRRIGATLGDLAAAYNPQLRGWLRYYGAYGRKALGSVFRQLDLALVRWARRKSRHLQQHRLQASTWIQRIVRRHPQLFAHWELTHGRGLSLRRAV